MKHVILTALLILGASIQSEACTIDIKVKKAEAKSGITQSGASMSLQTLEKTGCKINKTLFSEAELRQYKIDDLQKKLAKLQAK
jgi:hypothetical protein